MVSLFSYSKGMANDRALNPEPTQSLSRSHADGWVSTHSTLRDRTP
ncbi:hypothetical protein PN441_07480 [Spirulina major CS-329]|nr:MULTISPECIES: hypothetical protein [Spirulina]MDB9495030.1 hypothetical protein [Spirulina subsalsa CS-330]MDB9502909.1 hypothetical protein [Spirulina major CS-329]